MRPILAYFPKEVQGLEIAPRHKVLLDHVFVGSKCYVVLLTNMPGDADKVWEMSKKDYWGIQTLHESRDRWVRNRFTPTMEWVRNLPKESHIDGVQSVISLF